MGIVLIIIFIVSLGLGLCLNLLYMALDLPEIFYKIGIVALVISILVLFVGMLVSIKEVI